MIVNPVQFLLNSAGVGLREFGRMGNFAEKTVSDVVAGVYPAIPPRFVTFLSDLLDRKGVPQQGVLAANYETWDLAIAYEGWQHYSRQTYANIFNNPKINLNGNVDYGPAHFFIEDTCGSQYMFCRKLLVPPASVKRWESGATSKMPGSIADALREIGFSRLEELASAQEDWLDGHQTSSDD